MEPRSRSQTRSIRWSYWSWRFSTEPRLTCRNMCQWLGLWKAEAALLCSATHQVGHSVMTGFCEQTLRHLMNWASQIPLYLSLLGPRYWCQTSPPAVWAALQNSGPNEPNWTEHLYTTSEDRPIEAHFLDSGLVWCSSCSSSQNCHLQIVFTVWTKDVISCV